MHVFRFAHVTSICYSIQLRYLERPWSSFIFCSPNDFDVLCNLIYPRWILPRYGHCIKGRKHPVDACLFSVLGILKTGLSDGGMEAVVRMSHGLINIEFERICRGSARCLYDLIYLIDGCDFPKQRAMRAAIIIDTLWGKFRAVKVQAAGLNNDQGMMLNSAWNE
eukprot:634758_1